MGRVGYANEIVFGVLASHGRILSVLDIEEKEHDMNEVPEGLCTCEHVSTGTTVRLQQAGSWFIKGGCDTSSIYNQMRLIFWNSEFFYVSLL